MIYQFEHDEIKNCYECPLIDPEYGDCNITGTEGVNDAIPADCPLLAISKTETTSAKKITVDIQLRPLLDDLEVDIDDIKEYINKLD
jgi:hypothetical protein